MTARPIAPPPPTDDRRRRLLRGVPLAAGLVALQACGGGSSGPVAAAPPASGPTGGVAGLTVTSWAARPAAAAAVGQAVMVTDVGVNGSIWISNGSTWVSLASPLTLFHRVSNAEMDGAVGAGVDVQLDACTIPAYVLGPASALHIRAGYAFPGSGTGGKAPQVKAWFGLGSYASGFWSVLDSRGQFATQKSLLLELVLQNRNSLAVNLIRPNDYQGGISPNGIGQAAVDFAQAVTIGFGALNDAASANPNDRQRLEWFSVELVA